MKQNTNHASSDLPISKKIYYNQNKYIKALLTHVVYMWQISPFIWWGQYYNHAT